MKTHLQGGLTPSHTRCGRRFVLFTGERGAHAIYILLAAVDDPKFVTCRQCARPKRRKR